MLIRTVHSWPQVPPPRVSTKVLRRDCRAEEGGLTTRCAFKLRGGACAEGPAYSSCLTIILMAQRATASSRLDFRGAAMGISARASARSAPSRSRVGHPAVERRHFLTAHRGVLAIVQIADSMTRSISTSSRTRGSVGPSRMRSTTSLTAATTSGSPIRNR